MKRYKIIHNDYVSYVDADELIIEESGCYLQNEVDNCDYINVAFIPCSSMVTEHDDRSDMIEYQLMEIERLQQRNTSQRDKIYHLEEKLLKYINKPFFKRLFKI